MRMKRLKYYIALAVFAFQTQVFAQSATTEEFVDKVNQIRNHGCYCGEEYMPPVRPLVWNEKLQKSAENHAKDMQKHQFFAHFSSQGEDIGQRIFNAGYKWTVCGENLALGQNNMDDAITSWLRSSAHCKMLMNEEVSEMGIAHIGPFWVQHLANPK